MFDLIARWFGRLFACRHRRTYRERRPLKVGLYSDVDGLEVLHFVCEDCGHAEPCVDRTPEEHRRAQSQIPPRPRAMKRIVALDPRAMFALALDDQVSPALVDCLARLRRFKR